MVVSEGGYLEGFLEAVIFNRGGVFKRLQGLCCERWLSWEHHTVFG